MRCPVVVTDLADVVSHSSLHFCQHIPACIYSMLHKVWTLSMLAMQNQCVGCVQRQVMNAIDALQKSKRCVRDQPRHLPRIQPHTCNFVGQTCRGKIKKLFGTPIHNTLANNATQTSDHRPTTHINRKQLLQ